MRAETYSTSYYMGTKECNVPCKRMLLITLLILKLAIDDSPRSIVSDKNEVGYVDVLRREHESGSGRAKFKMRCIRLIPSRFGHLVSEGQLAQAADNPTNAANHWFVVTVGGIIQNITGCINPQKWTTANMSSTPPLLHGMLLQPLQHEGSFQT